MTNQSGPILAVIDCAADDAEVVAEAVWLARAARTDVALVHVAQPVAAGRLGGGAPFDRAFQQIAVEQRALSELSRLAEQVRAAGIEVRVEDVYFGDTSTEVADVASRRRASAVVAARRTSRLSGLLAWRSRDVRLGRLLSVPLVLIDARSAERRAPDALPDFELAPDERLLAPTPVAPDAPGRRLTRAA